MLGIISLQNQKIATFMTEIKEREKMTGVDFSKLLMYTRTLTLFVT